MGVGRVWPGGRVCGGRVCGRVCGVCVWWGLVCGGCVCVGRVCGGRSLSPRLNHTDLDPLSAVSDTDLDTDLDPQSAALI